MRKTEEKVYNEVIKPQIENLIKKYRENYISVSFTGSNKNRCGFLLVFGQHVLTGDETIHITTFNMKDSFVNWMVENDEWFLEMFKENGITPFYFFNEKILKDKATKGLIKNMGLNNATDEYNEMFN